MHSSRNGIAVTEIGVSDLMTVACLVPGSVPVQEHKMPNCCGSTLLGNTLYRILISSDIDLRHTVLGQEGILLLDNWCFISPLLWIRPPYSNFGQWTCLRATQSS